VAGEKRMTMIAWFPLVSFAAFMLGVVLWFEFGRGAARFIREEFDWRQQ
jgi:hypothetical protein